MKIDNLILTLHNYQIICLHYFILFFFSSSSQFFFNIIVILLIILLLLYLHIVTWILWFWYVKHISFISNVKLYFISNCHLQEERHDLLRFPRYRLSPPPIVLGFFLLLRLPLSFCFSFTVFQLSYFLLPLPIISLPLLFFTLEWRLFFYNILLNNFKYRWLGYHQSAYVFIIVLCKVWRKHKDCVKIIVTQQQVANITLFFSHELHDILSWGSFPIRTKI